MGAGRRGNGEQCGGRQNELHAPSGGRGLVLPLIQSNSEGKKGLELDLGLLSSGLKRLVGRLAVAVGVKSKLEWSEREMRRVRLPVQDVDE